MESEFGKRILQKMGWEPGKGLGRTEDGPLVPLQLAVKPDKKGLSASDDRLIGKKEKVEDIAGRNPVSVLMEYCNQRRWIPQFSCTESGTMKGRRFLWKV